MSRDDDAKVAELVFGWVWLEKMHNVGHDKHEPRKALMCPEGDRWVRFNWYAPDWKPARPETERFSDWDRCCGRRHENGHDMESWGVPKYTTDPAADYSVLVRVRETWSDEKQKRFAEALGLVAFFREGKFYQIACLNYRPGDYSLAALKVLAETSG